VTHHDLQHLNTEMKVLIWSSERNILHCDDFILIHICIPPPTINGSKVVHVIHVLIVTNLQAQ